MENWGLGRANGEGGSGGVLVMFGWGKWSMGVLMGFRWGLGGV